MQVAGFLSPEYYINFFKALLFPLHSMFSFSFLYYNLGADDSCEKIHFSQILLEYDEEYPLIYQGKTDDITAKRKTHSNLIGIKLRHLQYRLHLVTCFPIKRVMRGNKSNFAK